MAQGFLKEFRNDPNYLKRIALEYANSPLETTMDKVAEHFSITRDGVEIPLSRDNVQTAIERAITTNLISYQDCIKIRNKSDSNQHTHYTEKLSKTGKSIVKSRAQHKYDKLLLIRKDYIVANYTDEEILHAVKVYIMNPETENVWILIGLSKVELNAVFKKGIILGIIGENDFDEMRKISLSKAKSRAKIDATFRALEHVASLRNDRKRILDNIHLYEHQLECYDDFAQSDDYPYSKDDLEGIVASCKSELELFDYHVIDSL